MKKNTKAIPLEPKRSKIRGSLEILNWIIEILVGLIIIWQTFLPNIFKSSTKKKVGIHVTDSAQQNKPTNLKPIIHQLKDTVIRPSQTVKKERKAISQKLNINKDTVKSPKYNVTGPVTNSAIGDNASITNNYGESEVRHLNSDDINKMLRAIPSKDFPVEVDFSSSKRNSRNYGNEIANYLIKNGYKVDVPLIGLNVATFYPPLPESDRINIQKSDSLIKITVVNLD